MKVRNSQHLFFLYEKKLQTIVYKSDGEERTPIPTNAWRQNAKDKMIVQVLENDFDNKEWGVSIHKHIHTPVWIYTYVEASMFFL